MQTINFPRDTLMVGECVAMIARVGGPRRVEGPLLRGRPFIEFEGATWKIPRLSFHLNVHPISRTPATLKEGIVLHACDNPWCINPAHLSLGTGKQNIKDAWTRNPNYRANASAAHKGNSSALGNKLSEEVRAHISKKLLGNTNNRGKGKHQLKAKQNEKRL